MTVVLQIDFNGLVSKNDQFFAFPHHSELYFQFHY